MKTNLYRNIKLQVSIWNALATELDHISTDQEREALTEPLVVILTAVGIRKFMNKMTFTSITASKFYFDLNIPEPSLFRKR